MRVLTIFIDMIRANRLQTFNDEVKKSTPLDEAFKELGGTVYTNCFTPGPDTPRGMASYYTGLPPYLNGCTTRLKWPEYFLKPELKTVFDLFLEKEYALNVVSSINEQNNGFLPKYIKNMDVNNTDYNLKKYLMSIKLQEKHHLFISLPDYHLAFDDAGYSKNGEKIAYGEVRTSFDIIFECFDKDDFDHIFIFSDHGFKFLSEYKLDSPMYMINEDRINSIMLHRIKEENGLSRNNKLCTLMDLFATYQKILGKEVSHGIPLLDKEESDFVVIEDHISFAPQVNQNIELWALVSKELLYIRNLEKAILIDRRTGKEEEILVDEYDMLLKEKSSFAFYIDEYEKTVLYRKNIVHDKSQYMSGKVREDRSTFIKYFYIGQDLLLHFLTRIKAGK